MLLTVNPDIQEIVQAPLTTARLAGLSIPRQADVPIIVQFVRDNAIFDPDPDHTSGVLEIGKIYKITSYTAATAAVSITSSSIAADTLVTTSTAHGLAPGDLITIASHDSTPSINGNKTVLTVPSDTTFTIADQVTTGGTAVGTVTKRADDFTNVGAASNATNEYFTATGTTPTVWQNASILKFCSASGVVFSMRWTVKEIEKFDADPVALVTSFTKTGSGTSTKFRGVCSYMTEAIDTLLGVDPPTTANDEEQAELMGEISWTGGEASKTNWISHYVRNDIYKAGDVIPLTEAGFVGVNYRIKEDGTLQLKNTTTSKWHTLTVEGADGAGVLTIPVTGEA